LETIVIEDVFKLLECTEEGLSDEEAARRLGIFGPNKLESEEQNAFLQVRRLFQSSRLPAHVVWATVPQFHVEPALVGHGSCCPGRHCSFERWRTSAGLGRFRWYRSAPVRQLCYRILRGKECWKRCQGTHGLTCAQGQGEALWILARNRIFGIGSRRHDFV
jgi:hypothetical protein